MNPISALKQHFSAWATTACLALITTLAHATPIDVSLPRATIPPNVVTTSNRPMVMLTVSKDHSLFGPIYSDFEDLDDDGVIDTTFRPTFKYYGYFDPTKCYVYSTTDGQFNPAATATIVPTAVSGKTLDRYTCSSSVSQWSGNFLNWSTMTRLDVVRKMLYGGSRVVDANGNTVLEGTELTYDAHSFVKYYRGVDIRDYTPFTQAALTKSTGANKDIYAGLSICTTGTTDTAAGARPVMRLVKGNVRFWSTVEIELCRWRDSPDNYNKGTFGPKLAAYYKDADKGAGGIAHEITIPSRTTDGATYGGIGPELNVRVKVCDPNWLGQERCQAFPVSSTTNFKPYGLLQEFGYPSSSGGAARAEFGLITGSYDLNHTAGALRKNMSDFGDEINPATGVFCHSAASGCSTTALADGRTPAPGAIKALDSILLYGRANTSYGGGNTPSASGEGNLPAWGNPIGEMVVQALQYYAYNGSTPAQTNPGSTGNDTSVGMPVATWKDPLSNTYTGRSNLYGTAMCRPMSILAISPSALSFDGQAANPFATLPNRAGTLDNYTDIIGSAEGLNGTLRSVGSVSGKGLAAADDQNSCSAKTVGMLSNVNGICPEAPAMGGTYQVAGAALYGNTSKIRTIASPPSDLKYIEGALKVKTMAASLTGGSPRIDVPIPGTNPVKYIYITPESVQSGGKVSAPLTFASINSGPTYGTFMVTWNDVLMGGDYDMDITGFLRYDLQANAATPSGWDIKVTTDIPGVCGGGAGTHGFSIIGVQTSAGVNANGRYLTHQHYSSSILSGMPSTTEYLCGDSAYRAKPFLLPDGTKTTYADTVCNVTGTGATGDPGIPTLPAYCSVKPTPFPHSMTFRMVGETNALIKDPLWYAAKYGNFKSSFRNSDGTYTDIALPATQADWDSVKSDGTAGPDGVPDGYFLARRPEILEAQLRRALTDLSGKSNALPVVSSSQLVVATSGNEATLRYDVSFDPNTFSGNLEAFAINADGNFNISPTWSAGQLLGCRTKGPCSGVTADAGNSRQIITNYGNGTSAGTQFRWANLVADYRTQMTTNSRNVLSEANAQVALSYIRGDQSNESAAQLRERGANVLGPIVNSTPWVQTAPAANYFGSAFSGYVAFAKNNNTRSKLLWVGANDGMLHAFNPGTGAEVFAYVPGPLANRLAEIPLQRQSDASVTVTTKLGASTFVAGNETKPDGTIWPYVDGSPITGEISIGAYSASSTASAWRTYLLSSLGRGGRGVFALDVTDISRLQSGESNAASIFKWQFTSDDNPNLGYIANDFPVNASTRQPMPIAKLNNGKFAYLLGNGYKSSNGNASLFILFADGPSGTGGAWIKGTDYIEIVADVGPGNGLSQVMWQDLDSNGTADVVYAGDLLGNLWKFDLSGGSSASWAVAYKSGTVNKPLFTAKSGTTGTGTVRLPITTVPQYAYGEFDGSVILFGTGNAFETADYPGTVNQRVFGIWDRPAFKSGSRTLPTDLTTLAGRTLARQTDGSVSLTGSPASVDWTTQDGWYATLPASSEVIVSDSSVRARTLVFTSIRPPQSGTYCTTRPDATLYALDTLSGTAKRQLLGTSTSSTGVVTNSVGTAILDQKVKFVGDRTKAPFKTKEACVAGSPGCVCTGSKCEKPVTPSCNSGQKAPRIVGTNTSKTLCFNSNPRKQWREITGLRTDK